MHIICEITRSIAQYNPLGMPLLRVTRSRPVCTNGADVPLLDEGLDTSFLQNLRNMLEHSIVCSQACPPREPRVAESLVDRKPVRNNVDRRARLKTKKGHAGMIRKLELRLKKKAE